MYYALLSYRVTRRRPVIRGILIVSSKTQRVTIVLHTHLQLRLVAFPVALTISTYTYRYLPIVIHMRKCMVFWETPLWNMVHNNAGPATERNDHDYNRVSLCSFLFRKVKRSNFFLLRIDCTAWELSAPIILYCCAIESASTSVGLDKVWGFFILFFDYHGVVFVNSKFWK